MFFVSNFIDWIGGRRFVAKRLCFMYVDSWYVTFYTNFHVWLSNGRNWITFVFCIFANFNPFFCVATFDLASRLTLPALTDRLKISCRVIFLVGAIFLTACRAILAETSNRNNLIVMSAIYGYVRAATVVNQNLTISEYAKPDKLASSLSLTMIMKGVCVMTIGQLLGNYSTMCYLVFVFLCSFIFHVFRIPSVIHV